VKKNSLYFAQRFMLQKPVLLLHFYQRNFGGVFLYSQMEVARLCHPHGSSPALPFALACGLRGVSWERTTVEWDPPYNATLPHHLEGVTRPTCLVVLLQFIHNLDGVFPRGPIIEQEYAIFIIEAVGVTDGEPVTRHAESARRLTFRSCVLFPS